MADLSIYEFGEQLLETRDLDPVYVVLWNAELDHDDNHGHEDSVLERWLLAYWCFYHVGTASWISAAEDYEEYWKRMRAAAGSKEYPRSSERRHFRGAQAAKSVEYLARRGVFDLFTSLTAIEPPKTQLSVQEVMEDVQSWVGFGPWIAFKVADMVERLGLVPVKFDNAAMLLFDSPREGSEMLWNVTHPGEPAPKNVGSWAVSNVIKHFHSVKAPPRYERTVNAQEAETILCKWKSYRKGHYEVGEDVEAVRKGLQRFPGCPIAKQLMDGGHKGGLW